MEIASLGALSKLVGANGVENAWPIRQRGLATAGRPIRLEDNRIPPAGHAPAHTARPNHWATEEFIMRLSAIVLLVAGLSAAELQAQVSVATPRPSGRVGARAFSLPRGGVGRGLGGFGGGLGGGLGFGGFGFIERIRM